MMSSQVTSVYQEMLEGMPTGKNVALPKYSTVNYAPGVKALMQAV